MNSIKTPGHIYHLPKIFTISFLIIGPLYSSQIQLMNKMQN